MSWHSAPSPSVRSSSSSSACWESTKTRTETKTTAQTKNDGGDGNPYLNAGAPVILHKAGTGTLRSILGATTSMSLDTGGWALYQTRSFTEEANISGELTRLTMKVGPAN